MQVHQQLQAFDVAAGQADNFDELQLTLLVDNIGAVWYGVPVHGAEDQSV
jgi:hypothetical protein